MKIAGCTALVTGANRGIGEALVLALLQRGARYPKRAERHHDVRLKDLPLFGQLPG